MNGMLKSITSLLCGVIVKSQIPRSARYKSVKLYSFIFSFSGRWYLTNHSQKKSMLMDDCKQKETKLASKGKELKKSINLNIMTSIQTNV